MSPEYDPLPIVMTIEPTATYCVPRVPTNDTAPVSACVVRIARWPTSVAVGATDAVNDRADAIDFVPINDVDAVKSRDAVLPNAPVGVSDAVSARLMTLDCEPMNVSDALAVLNADKLARGVMATVNERVAERANTADDESTAANGRATALPYEPTNEVAAVNGRAIALVCDPVNVSVAAMLGRVVRFVCEPENVSPAVRFFVLIVPGVV